MKKRIVAGLGVCVATLGLVAGLALASSGGVTVAIPFDFVAKETELKAGTYEIRPDSSGSGHLLIRNTTSGKTSIVPVMTRLASFGGSSPKIVFDKTEEGKRYLSEFHIPGLDGFAIQGAPGTHTHETLTPKQ